MAMKQFLGPAVAMLLLIGVAPSALADHPQPIENLGTETVRFDHRGGNEWWMEVNVTVTGGYQVNGVSARAESGTWQRLELKTWGNWAASFHIPPGERVHFQAHQPGSMSDVWRRNSCFFTHPAGVEQCDPGATDPLTVSFRPVPGNQWWEEVYVTSNRPLGYAAVAFYTADTWVYHTLQKRSWGSYATSQFAPQGTTVKFLVSDNAEGRSSGCYRWVNAEPITCPPNYGPNSPSGYMTRFDHVKGNEWWVEVDVGPVEPTRVMAQDDGGPWTEISKREWGGGLWAGSFHIEPGHKVRFQAYADDQWRLSCWFTHPQGVGENGEQVCEDIE